MEQPIAKALLQLTPTALWHLKGDTYADIVWKSPEITKPTETEVNNKITELQDTEPMRLLRLERDSKLAACDWVVLSDSQLTTSKKTAWKTYRQSLRDLPASASPKLDSDGNLDISSVTFPTEPS